jgi:hypothetical protein
MWSRSPHCGAAAEAYFRTPRRPAVVQLLKTFEKSLEIFEADLARLLEGRDAK